VAEAASAHDPAPAALALAFRKLPLGMGAAEEADDGCAIAAPASAPRTPVI